MGAEARYVGGRSGGPAVAVATGMAYAALSSDVLGDLRLTAAYSGIVGLKTSKVSCMRKSSPGRCRQLAILLSTAC